MRLAFVVQRYGLEVNGGAEYHCRVLAEHLAARPGMDISVLTTCARDHSTWANAYPQGETTINGVRVERFPVAFPRLRPVQWAFSQVVLHGPRVRALEHPWIVAQGPYAPGLVRRLGELSRDVDAFVFFTYLYHPTVAGLRVVGDRAILVPTAHDEPAIRMALFNDVFRLPRGFAFNTPEERDFVVGRFGVGETPAALVGCGIDVPPLPDAPPPRPSGLPDRPTLLYLGRIESKKGIPELLAGFSALKRRHASTCFTSDLGTYRGSDLQLVLAGRADMPLPRSSDVVAAGFVDDATKDALLDSCEALMMPSRFESLSLVLLEAWARARPALVEGACDVTAGQTARSGGGLVYGGERDLVDKTARLLANPDERRALGASGRRFVEDTYAWDRVLDRLLGLVDRAIPGRTS